MSVLLWFFRLCLFLCALICRQCLLMEQIKLHLCEPVCLKQKKVIAFSASFSWLFQHGHMIIPEQISLAKGVYCSNWLVCSTPRDNWYSCYLSVNHMKSKVEVRGYWGDVIKYCGRNHKCQTSWGINNWSYFFIWSIR
jgi:hypothetical protein